MKKKILFIINPKAGTNAKTRLLEMLLKNIDKNIFEAETKFTEYTEHASQMTKEAVEKNFDVVCAVGGDGTMNEVARELVDKKTSLALIPIGSGNALARYLGISMKIEKATKQINSAKTIQIDVCKMNEKYFFNAAGVGFDAKVAHLFANGNQRGFWGYFFIILKEFLSYKTQNYTLNIDGQEKRIDAFLIAFANSNQYGNNFIIAPQADIQDGNIEVTVIRKFPLLLAPYLFLLFYFKKHHWSKYISTSKAKNIFVESENLKEAHIDGEPIFAYKKVEIQIKPLSLNVLIPNK